MTRSFLTRSAIAAVLLGFGLAFVWGDNSMFDKIISKFNVVAVAVILATLVAFWVALTLWVVLALKPTKWARREASHGKIATVLAVIVAACLPGQPAQAMVMELPVAAQTYAQSVDRPFALSLDLQGQVDEAVAKCGKDAKDSPGFVISLELAVGIFIAAVVVGTVLVIIVRLVCKSLDRMRDDLGSRLGRLKDFLSNPGTNQTQPVILGAALFSHRSATTNDLSMNVELVVGFTASSEPPALTAAVENGEKVAISEFLADFGLKDNLPLDSSVGQGVDRVEGGYQVVPAGVSNLVTLVIESTTNLVQQVWKRSVTITVPAGAILDFSDLTGNSEARFWRVEVVK